MDRIYEAELIVNNRLQLSSVKAVNKFDAHSQLLEKYESNKNDIQILKIEYMHS